jgi:hypothetical protein
VESRHHQPRQDAKKRVRQNIMIKMDRDRERSRSMIPNVVL